MSTDCYFFVFYRKCEHCDVILKTQSGLKRHETLKKDRPCGTWARRTRKNANMLIQNERFDKIRKTKMKDLPKKFVGGNFVEPTTIPKLKNRPRGEPVTKEEKRMMAHIYDTNMEDLNDMRNSEPKVKNAQIFQEKQKIKLCDDRKQNHYKIFSALKDSCMSGLYLLLLFISKCLFQNVHFKIFISKSLFHKHCRQSN